MFCLPIVAAEQPAAPDAAPRCLGALLLSFASPAHLDAAHARNLLLLSRAMAPGLLAAAGPLLQQCALILGVQPLALLEAGGAEEEEEEEEEEGSVYLSDSEAEAEGELPPVWEEEEAEAAALAEEEETLRQQQQAQQQPQWAAGSCREPPPEPPEDPGSASAALAVQPQPAAQAETKAEVAAAGERRAQRSGSDSGGMAAPAAAATAALVAVPPSSTAVASRIASFETTGSLETPRSPLLLEARQVPSPVPPEQHPPTSPRAALAGRSRLSIEGPRSAELPPEPESPSVIKAKAKAAAAGVAAAAGEAAVGEGASTSAGPGSGGGGPGPGFSAADFSAPPLLKVSPTESETSMESAASAQLAREAGSSLRRLLRFEDAALEARFARWLHAQLWRVRRGWGCCVWAEGVRRVGALRCAERGQCSHNVLTSAAVHQVCRVCILILAFCCPASCRRTCCQCAWRSPCSSRCCAPAAAVARHAPGPCCSGPLCWCRWRSCWAGAQREHGMTQRAQRAQHAQHVYIAACLHPCAQYCNLQFSQHGTFQPPCPVHPLSRSCSPASLHCFAGTCSTATSSWRYGTCPAAAGAFAPQPAPAAAGRPHPAAVARAAGFPGWGPCQWWRWGWAPSCAAWLPGHR